MVFFSVRCFEASPEATLTFLGYTFRYALDLHGRGHRYLTLYPSLKAMEREREKIREMTSARYSSVPARKLIDALNAHLKGWKSYYKMGHCRRQFRQINYYVGMRVLRHLRRRSQRGYRTPGNLSGNAYLQQLGYNSCKPTGKRQSLRPRECRKAV